MPKSKLEIIRNSILNGEDGEAVYLVKEALASGLTAVEILQSGLIAGIKKAGELWKSYEYFMPDVLLAADAYKAAFEILEPELKKEGKKPINKKFVIGVVHGDLHDLGKNLVITMLSSVGFEVIDLGIDVPNEEFIEAVKVHKPDILGIGAYMTTTIPEIKKIITDIVTSGIRDQVKIMIGGSCITKAILSDSGADAWGEDALSTVQTAMKLS